jgi:hypothetical protein
MKWLFLLCLLLIVMSAFVQAVHMHHPGATDEIKDCPFCQIATATIVVALVVLLYFVEGTAAFVAFAEQTEAKTVFRCLTLFSRPPPLA